MRNSGLGPLRRLARLIFEQHNKRINPRIMLRDLAKVGVQQFHG